MRSPTTPAPTPMPIFAPAESPPPPLDDGEDDCEDDAAVSATVLPDDVEPAPGAKDEVVPDMEAEDVADGRPPGGRSDDWKLS